MSAQASTFRLRGVHVAMMMVAFFSVVIGVNTTFIVLAARSFPGLVVSEPFSKGLAKNVNADMDARAEQAARDWRAGVASGYDSELSAARIEVTLLGLNDAPVAGRAVTGVLKRPTTDADDRDVVFQDLGAGVYGVEVANIPPGVWDLTFETAFDDGARFEARRRLWLR